MNVHLKHIKPFFDRLLVTDIRALDIAEYQKARLKEEASPKTVNLEVGTIRSILRRNRVWPDIQPDVRMLATRDDIGKALETNEEEALLSCCLTSRSRSLYPAVVLALNCGMRYGEIRLLRWKQLNFQNKTILVDKSKTENGTGRTIPLNARVFVVLEMWAAHFPDRKPEHYVFPSEKYGAGTDEFKPCVYGVDPTKPINDWKEAWEGAKKRAGTILQLAEASDQKAVRTAEQRFLPLHCRFHDLRHTACTRLLEGGVPYHVVSTIMGWSAATAIRMAKRYGHIGQKALREAMEVLETVEIPAGSPKNPPRPESVECAKLN